MNKVREPYGVLDKEDRDVIPHDVYDDMSVLKLKRLPWGQQSHTEVAFICVTSHQVSTHTRKFRPKRLTI